VVALRRVVDGEANTVIAVLPEPGDEVRAVADDAEYKTTVQALSATEQESARFLELARDREHRATARPDFRKRWGAQYEANAKILHDVVERLSEAQYQALERSRLSWDADVIDLLVAVGKRRAATGGR